MGPAVKYRIKHLLDMIRPTMTKPYTATTDVSAAIIVFGLMWFNLG